MSTSGRTVFVLVGAIGMLGATLVSGCATQEQWADWRGHSSHFASGQHMAFSMRHTEGSVPRVRAPTWRRPASRTGGGGSSR